MKRKLFKTLTSFMFLSLLLTSCADNNNISSNDNNSNHLSSDITSDIISDNKDATLSFKHKDVSLYENDSFDLVMISENIDGTIFYQSSNESIATVENGKIIAKKEGNVVISAQYEELIATCNVKVMPSISLSFDNNDVTIYLKKTMQLKPKYFFKGNEDTTKTFTFKSENETIATVDNNGYVTGKKVGSTTIKATCDNQEISIDVEVKDLISISLSTDEIELIANETKSITIEAKVKKNGVNVKSAQIKWSILDNDVASLSANANKVTLNANKCGKTALIGEYGGEIATCVIYSYKTIRNVEDMEAIKADKDGWYKVMNDIDFNNYTWQPITPWAGDEVPLTAYFGGIFDGQGYTLSNINFIAGWHSALFGEINEQAIVKNVSLVNTVHQSSSNKTGSICALNHGKIENIYAETTINADSQNMWNSTGGLIATTYPGSSVRNCIVKVNANKTYKNVGALIGYNCGDIENCFAIVSKNASFPFIYQYTNDLGTITNSYSVSDEEALFNEKLYYEYDKDVWNVTKYDLPSLKNYGKVNFNSKETYLTLNKTYKMNPSNVLGLKQTYEYSGDISCFDIYFDDNGTLNVTPIGIGTMDVKVSLENGSYATTKFISKNVVLVPSLKDVSLNYNNPKYSPNYQITLKDENGNDIDNSAVSYQIANNSIASVSSSGLISALSGGNTTVSIIYDGSVYQDSIKIDVTPWKQISTVEDFNNIRKDLSANYCLVNDIDYLGNTYQPIGMYDGNESKNSHFNGVFDGNGHSISNLVIASAGDTSGIFGLTLETSIIRNINFLNISGNENTTTSAGIVGFNEGLIENVYVEFKATKGGSTSIKACGSIVGTNEFRGTIRNCISVVNVDSMPDNNFFGSLVGLNQGVLENSFSVVYGNMASKASVISYDNGFNRNCSQYTGSTKEQAISNAIKNEAPFGSFSKDNWIISNNALPKLVLIA